jgi:hypothetical protein
MDELEEWAAILWDIAFLEGFAKSNEERAYAHEELQKLGYPFEEAS